MCTTSLIEQSVNLAAAYSQLPSANSLLSFSYEVTEIVPRLQVLSDLFSSRLSIAI